MIGAVGQTPVQHAWHPLEVILSFQFRSIGSVTEFSAFPLYCYSSWLFAVVDALEASEHETSRRF